jgi:hypothetical protein
MRVSFATFLILFWLSGNGQILTTVATSDYLDRKLSDKYPGVYLEQAGALAIDGQSNIYIADANNVIKISSSGMVDLVGKQRGQFSRPGGLATDRSGNLYIADTFDHTIKKLDNAGNLSIVAGISVNQHPGDLFGLSSGNDQNTLATAQRFWLLFDVATDGNGNVYFEDNTIYKVDATGNFNKEDNTAREYFCPHDGLGNYYVIDHGVDNVNSALGNYENTISKVSPDGNRIVIAGGGTNKPADGAVATSVHLNHIGGVTADENGNVFIAEWQAGYESSHIYEISEQGTIKLIAGGDKIGDMAKFFELKDRINPSTVTFGNKIFSLVLDRLGNLYFITDSTLGFPAVFKIYINGVPSPPVPMREATTLDAKSVTVFFDKTKKLETAQTNTFQVYRSNEPVKNALAVPIGQPTKLTITPGEDKVTLLPDTPLLPDTRFPYIVVEEFGSDGTEISTYFRKWMLGAIAHGFNPYAHMSWDWVSNNLISVPKWETDMADKLKDKKSGDGYDDVIAFDWVTASGTSKPNLAVNEGTDLADQIWKKINDLHRMNQHLGDVVDLHLIGHSRGTVVVDQALEQLQKFFPQSGAPYGGGYIVLTLLDPHPANNNLETPWCSTAFRKTHDESLNINQYWNCENREVGFSSFFSHLQIFLSTKNFQDAASDPGIQIPDGVSKIEIWYQHTPAYQLCDKGALNPESLMNLWGMVSPATINSLNNKIAINRTDLTNVNIDGIGFIGHSEVPLIYEQLWVDSGTLNRSPETTVKQ